MLSKLLDEITDIRSEIYFLHKDLLQGEGMNVTFYTYKKENGERGQDLYLNTETLNNKDRIVGLGAFLAFFNRQSTNPRSEMVQSLYLYSIKEDILNVTVKVKDKTFHQRGTIGQLNLKKDPWFDFVETLEPGDQVIEINLKAEMVADHWRKDRESRISDTEQYLKEIQTDYNGNKKSYPDYYYTDVIHYEIMFDPYQEFSEDKKKAKADAAVSKLEALKDQFKANSFYFGIPNSPERKEKPKKHPSKAQASVAQKVNTPYHKLPLIISKKGITNLLFELREEIRVKLLNDSLKMDMFCLKTKNGIFLNKKKITKKDQIQSVATIFKYIPGEYSAYWSPYVPDEKAIMSANISVDDKLLNVSGKRGTLGRGEHKEEWQSFIKDIPLGAFKLEINLSVHNTQENNQEILKRDLESQPHNAEKALLLSVTQRGLVSFDEKDLLEIQSGNTDLRTYELIGNYLEVSRRGEEIWMKDYPKDLSEALDRGQKYCSGMTDLINRVKSGRKISLGIDPENPDLPCDSFTCS